MDKRHDTALDGLMEQLIEGGVENIGTVFARLYELAMQIERERFLGAQHYERSPSRKGYANGYKPKRIDFHSEMTLSACYIHCELTHLLIQMPSVMRLTHHYHIVDTCNESLRSKAAGAAIIGRKENS